MPWNYGFFIYKAAVEYLKLNKAIEEINDLEIYDVDIMFIGLCKKCRKEKERQEQ